MDVVSAVVLNMRKVAFSICPVQARMVSDTTVLENPDAGFAIYQNRSISRGESGKCFCVPQKPLFSSSSSGLSIKLMPKSTCCFISANKNQGAG
jgi:hypothetical protein